MKSLILSSIFFSHLVFANTFMSQEFIDYHMKVTLEEVDENLFNLIEENVNNLSYCTVSDYSALELIHLIEEGYKIDPFNMAKLIESLKNVTARENTTKVIIKAIEFHSSITNEHLQSLIQTLSWVPASDNATKILLKAIDCDIEFGPKQRLLLAEISKNVSARENVEKIRHALHKKLMQS